MRLRGRRKFWPRFRERDGARIVNVINHKLPKKNNVVIKSVCESEA